MVRFDLPRQTRPERGKTSLLKSNLKWENRREDVIIIFPATLLPVTEADDRTEGIASGFVT